MAAIVPGKFLGQHTCIAEHPSTKCIMFVGLNLSMNTKLSQPDLGGNKNKTPAPITIDQYLMLSDVNIVRIVFIILLLLSLFIIAKSFIATYNVEQWSDDIWRMFASEQAEAGKRSYPIDVYHRKLDAIQKQWSVMRYVSVTMTALSCFGIYLTCRRERKESSETKQTGEKSESLQQEKLNRRLIFALICTLPVPLLEFLLGNSFGLIVLPCIALVILLPVLIRGSYQQRFFTVLLMLPAGYFTYRIWVTVIQLWLR